MKDIFGKIRRGLKKPPREIARRIVAELRAELERFIAPSRAYIKLDTLLSRLEARSLEALWEELAGRPYLASVTGVDRDSLNACCPESFKSVVARAEEALVHRVSLLGSGVKDLGVDIDWHRDFKTGYDWSPNYFRDIDYTNPERPSDVKVPWELSRLQWLIPAGQAYLLTGDERYASGVRSVLEQWIDSNPYASSVNWACTMEVALRILTWTWFFHVFHASLSWKDTTFREKFLRTLYLHVDFTERHIERSDVNGNHYTADAAGLVVGGLFFGKGSDADRWAEEGWCILCNEIELQTYPDGVDFEASVPYHRLVAELFLLPAMYRMRAGKPVETTYRDRLIAMARFTAAYTKPDAMVPLWGDADDARALPFGSQSINDHRYLVGLVGLTFGDTRLIGKFNGPREEIYWALGESAAKSLPDEPEFMPSTAFPQGGFYVMRGTRDYAFIDCGPIGLAGRGGHGHNDCLAFEAVLDGVPLISDCGAYLYTASYQERNAFRSTAFHNTPQIDGEEINRFIRPDYLWNMHYDAIPEVLAWQAQRDFAIFVGQHAGYQRLSAPVVPRRTIQMDFERHALFVGDQFVSSGLHHVQVPWHLAPGVEILEVTHKHLRLQARGKSFNVWWHSASDYVFEIEDARVSPSYGVVRHTKKLSWRMGKGLAQPIAVYMAPSSEDIAQIETRIKTRLIESGQDWVW